MHVYRECKSETATGAELRSIGGVVVVIAAAAAAGATKLRETSVGVCARVACSSFFNASARVSSQMCSGPTLRWWARVCVCVRALARVYYVYVHTCACARCLLLASLARRAYYTHICACGVVYVLRVHVSANERACVSDSQWLPTLGGKRVSASVRSSFVACYEHPLPVLGVVLYDAYIVSRLFIRRPYTTRTLFPPSRIPPPPAGLSFRLSSSTVFPLPPTLFLPAPPWRCINSFPTITTTTLLLPHRRRCRPYGIYRLLFLSLFLARVLSLALFHFTPSLSRSYAFPLHAQYVFLFLLLRLSFSSFPPPLCLFLRPVTTSANMSESTRFSSLSYSVPPSAAAPLAVVLLRTRGMRRQEFSLTMDLLC